MRAAFFDIGTNSIHLLVVEIRQDLTFDILDHEKDDTRLGDGSFESRRLKKETMRRAIGVIDRFCKIARKYGVTKTVAKATSAVRDAKNGREFAQAVQRRTGVRVEIISGEEESRLIFLGACANVETNGKRVLVIDIGGGSAELIVGNAGKADFLKSYPLGVARLTDHFLKNDPPTAKELKKIARHVTKTVGKDAKKIKKLGFSMAIGTSGTLINLGSMVYEAKTKRPLFPVNQFEFSEKSLRKIHDKLVKLNLKERLKLPGLDAKRADLIVAGSTETATLMQLLKMRSLTLSSGGIRDGMVLDFIAKNRKSFNAGDEGYSIREKSVRALARRCSPDMKHDEQVAKLALSIFDDTRPVHRLGEAEKELLSYCALLHDIGRHVSFKKYQKHTHYLIVNGDLDGFTPEEIEMMSWVAREAVPKKKERHFVSRSGVEKIRVLSAILRVADALDRSRFSVIKSLECRIGPSAVSIRLKTVKDADLEIWQAQAKSELFEEVFGRKLVLSALK